MGTSREIPRVEAILIVINYNFAIVSILFNPKSNQEGTKEIERNKIQTISRGTIKNLKRLNKRLTVY